MQLFIQSIKSVVQRWSFVFGINIGKAQSLKQDTGCKHVLHIKLVLKIKFYFKIVCIIGVSYSQLTSDI